MHGLGASFWTWWHNIPRLAEHFQVVAYDLKGCGNSGKGCGDLTPEGCTAQLIDLLDHLGIKRAALVGHSMGSRVALNTALEHPDRVEALTLVSPSCYPQTVGRAVRFLVLPGIGELYTRAKFAGPAEKLVRRALRFCMHSSITISGDEVFWNMCSGAQEIPLLAQSYLRYGREMRFHEVWQQANRFGEIRVPALIIGGEADPFVPLDHVNRLAQALPRARAEIWPFTRHMAYAEHHERFNWTVRDFLRRHLAIRPVATQPPATLPVAA